jgi:biopolymer transport protein ExbD
MKRRSCKPDEPVTPLPLRPLTMPDLTPLLGVLLVIVVSFMAALPSPKTLDVKLPIQVGTWEEADRTDPCVAEMLNVAYKADGHVEINRDDVSVDKLGVRLAGILQEMLPACRGVYLSAPAETPYGTVAHIVDIAKQAGALRIVMLDSRWSQW